MTSAITVADLNADLAGYAPGGMSFLQALNQVMKRFWDAGYFKNLVAKVNIASSTPDGWFSLPPQYESLVGVMAENGKPIPVYGQYHEWQELGIGFIDPDEMTMIGAIDMGDGYCTTADIATEGTLRFKIYNSADAGKYVRIFGTGTVNGIAGQEVFNTSDGRKGIRLTTVNATADTTQTFSSLAPPFGGIQLPSNMTGISELYVVNSGTATLLARYLPNETRPCYRRYKVGVADQPVIGLCKMRFMPYRDETDFVKPACHGAISAGLQALTKEQGMQYDEAIKIWSHAVRLLNLQLRSFMGSAKPRFAFLGKELLCGPTTVS